MGTNSALLSINIVFTLLGVVPTIFKQTCFFPRGSVWVSSAPDLIQGPGWLILWAADQRIGLCIVINHKAITRGMSAGDNGSAAPGPDRSPLLPQYTTRPPFYTHAVSQPASNLQNVPPLWTASDSFAAQPVPRRLE